MLKALIIDRFKLTTHYEDRPGDTYTLVAAKPKMKKADPANRTGFKEGPGPDGKDPRKDTAALGRLVTCTNMSMAQLADALPQIASGYFQNASTTVIDATGVEGSFDFTLSFSGAGILKNNGGGRGGDAPPKPAEAAGREWLRIRGRDDALRCDGETDRDQNGDPEAADACAGDRSY